MAHYTLSAYQAKLQKMSQRSPEIVQQALASVAKQAVEYVQSTRLSGPRMARGSYGTNRDTLANSRGTLFNHIEYRLSTSTAKRQQARIGFFDAHSKMVAGVQQKGAMIFAKNGKYMKFFDRGKWFRLPMVVIPPRPFLRRAMNEIRPKLLQELSSRLSLGFQEGEAG